uniref:Uncharacterized protein n=1 Tax=Plectus sambesii TaxID=2011161 RepID=A0A914VIV6_9BILA
MDPEVSTDGMEFADLLQNLTDTLDIMPVFADNVTLARVRPEAWQKWGIGLAIITACSFSAPTAILFLSFISKNTFSRIINFLIALGVGALSGSALFILLPSAFHVEELASQDYVYKSWMTLGGIYMLFVIDKLLKFFFEIRKMQKAKRKIQGQNNLEQVVVHVIDSADKNYTPPSNPAFSEIPSPLDADPEVILTPQILAAKKMSDDDDESGEIKSVAFMLLLGSWINNFMDGLSIGAAFTESFIRGLSLGIAVFLQQFPQELASLAIIISSGLGLKKALLLNLIQTVLSYIGFIIGVLLDNVNEGYDDIIFAISAGMYLYICLSTLVSSFFSIYLTPY